MKRYILEVRYLIVLMSLMKDSSKNIQIPAFHIFKVFVANPSKPREVKMILAKKKICWSCFITSQLEKVIMLSNCSRVLWHLDTRTGAEDEQFEEEKELIIKEIDKLSRLSNLDPQTFILNASISFFYSDSVSGSC